MKWTEELLELFNNMFEITHEYDAYRVGKAFLDGEGKPYFEEGEAEENFSTSQLEVYIDGETYKISFGVIIEDMNDIALSLFEEFVKHDLDKQWLINKIEKDKRFD